MLKIKRKLNKKKKKRNGSSTIHKSNLNNSSDHKLKMSFIFTLFFLLLRKGYVSRNEIYSSFQ